MLKIWFRNTLFWGSFIAICFNPFNIINVQAKNDKAIQTNEISIISDQIKKIEFGIHISQFESFHKEYSLVVNGKLLEDNKIKAPISILKPLLSSLKGMYPGTRPLNWIKWTDDYPHAWVVIKLKDGRVLKIESDSQYEGMYPWIISIWESENSPWPIESYIHLGPSVLEGIDTLWKGIGEKGFPRMHTNPYGLDMALEGTNSDTQVFGSSYMEFDTDLSEVKGFRAQTVNQFLPLLQSNSEIRKLLDHGYSIYDCFFTLKIKVKELIPVEYSGMIAFLAPDGRDAIVSTVDIPLDGNPVTTPLHATNAFELVEIRKKSDFLNRTQQLLGQLTFIHDTRQEEKKKEFSCNEDPSISLIGKPVKAIWNTKDPKSIILYPLSENRWAIDFQFNITDSGWNNDLVTQLMHEWFPEPIASIPVKDLQGISTGADGNGGWSVAFLPGATPNETDYLKRITRNLPNTTFIHEQNSEKDGDFNFISLNGRTILSEPPRTAEVVNCGKYIPDYYGSPYPIEEVHYPDEEASRNNLWNNLGRKGEWTGISGIFPDKANWTSITFSKPGFLHVLSANDEGVYYADGWIDGTGWINPQCLGDGAWSVKIKAFPDGETHLFWDAGLNTGGTIHVWKSAKGIWQKAEHWPKIGYFSDVFRDFKGVLHITYIGSDGLDTEFFHQTWTADKGLSAPENISRMTGDIGNTDTVIRIDSNGRLHAAWSHILKMTRAPDVLTGETSDISGVFYAHQLEDGRWSKPEQLGILASYAHTLGLELSSDNRPIIIWQTEEGLVSRIKNEDVWQPPMLFARVDAPKAPAEFGPDREVKPSATIKTAIDTQGNVYVSWLSYLSGLKIAKWNENKWSNPITIVESRNKETKWEEFESTTNSDAKYQEYPSLSHLQMLIDSSNKIHFAYFKDMDLNYSFYDNGKITTSPLGPPYNDYGFMEIQFEIDSLDSVAILGLPRTPFIETKFDTVFEYK